MQDLNAKQSEYLASFFFDLSKGLALGSVAFYAVPFTDISVSLRLLSILSGLSASYILARIGLDLLK